MTEFLAAIYYYLLATAFTFGVHLKRERTFRTITSLSGYHYVSFIEEYEKISLLKCSQFCVDKNCWSLTFDKTDGKCRTHSRRLCEKINGEEAINSTYYIMPEIGKFFADRDYINLSEIII